MKKHIFALFLMATATVMHGQHTSFSEQFENDSDGWYTKNNTFPRPAAPSVWSRSGESKYLGPQPGNELEDFANGFSEFLASLTGASFADPSYPYMSVEYSSYDYDGALMSNWLISPVIRDMKNGDIISFRTKQYTSDYFNDKILGAFHINSDDLLACTRPNRLEVRLSTKTEGTPDVGSTALDVGDFTIQLGVINDNLATNGYPGDWRDYSFEVRGLPKGTKVDGRIAFWYHFENGGYDNCKVRRNLPELSQAVIDEGASALADAVGEGAGSKYAIGFQAVVAGFDVIQALTQDHIGTNGSAIAIDNVSHSEGTYIEDSDSDKIWNDHTGAGKILMGYQGEKGCGDFKERWHEKLLHINNYSDQSITLYPYLRSYVNGSASPPQIDVQIIGPNTIEPGRASSIKLTLKDNLYQPLKGSAILTFHEVENGGGSTVLRGLEIDLDIEDYGPPKLVVNPHIGIQTVTLNEFGYGDLDASVFDGGSTNSCGGTEGLSFSIPYQYCGDLGVKEVELTVSQTIPRPGYQDSQKSSTRKVTIEVKAPSPVFEDLEETYYLSEHQNAVAVSDLKKPEVITASCDIVDFKPVEFRKGSFGPFQSVYQNVSHVGIGTYDVTWDYFSGLTPGVRGSVLHVVDTVKPDIAPWNFPIIAFTEERFGELMIKDKIRGEDIVSARDNVGIARYELSTAWYNGGAWVREIPMDCADAGEQFSVTVRAYDQSGNYSQIDNTIRIADPEVAECRDIKIDIDTARGFTIIAPDDLLLSGSDLVCDINNASVSRFRFDCNDVNQVIPVTVSYLDGSGVERTCESNVSVNEYSEVKIQDDTIYASVGAQYLEATVRLDPLITSVCSDQLLWSYEANGATNRYESDLTGTKYRSFRPGLTVLTRTTTYQDSVYTSRQAVVVTDDIDPVVLSTPQDIDIDLPSLANGACTRDFDIVNPFQQGTYISWSYTLTGATEETQTFNLEGDPYYYQDRVVGFYPGITQVTLSATDRAGNTSTVSYQVDLFVQDRGAPYVSASELDTTPIVGNFEGENLLLEIESPFHVACDQTGYMWYFEVRDSYQGNIISSEDSIPQNSGAYIPLKIGALYDQQPSRTVQLGYHEKTYGTKVLSTWKTVQVIDTISSITCPSMVTIENDNSTSFDYEYTINPPAGLLQGDRWGYAITGATELKTDSSSVSYTANQEYTLTNSTLAGGYPTLAHDSAAVVTLKNGINHIQLDFLEASGNVPSPCTYSVDIKDISVPTLECPPADTLYRTNVGSCDASVISTCQQVDGFSGLYGKTGMRPLGGNGSVLLDKENAPTSIRFRSVKSTLDYKDAYTEFMVRCSGTITFDWEYQSQNPQFFTPFIFVKTSSNQYAMPQPSGFSKSVTGVQTGTFSQAVNPGDKLYIGVLEGGADAGYFKISNFSAPQPTIVAELAGPSVLDHPVYYLHSDMENEYPIGTHEITYTLQNVVNKKTATCVQTITVLDTYESSLACADATIYLNDGGIAKLSLDDVVNSCFPVGSTTLDKASFDYTDLGTQQVEITSVDQSGDSLNCTINVTVIDNLKPTPVGGNLFVTLDRDTETGLLADSVLLSSFRDNGGIESVTASQTSFTCSDVGTQRITLTATDSSGNTVTTERLVEVYPFGMTSKEPAITIEACEGDLVELTPAIVPAENPYLQYTWQVRDPNDSIPKWNYYASSAGIEMVPNSSNHRFFRLRLSEYADDTYMVYMKDGSQDLHFSKLNKNKGSWQPAFPTLPREISNYGGTKESFFVGAFGSDNSFYTVYLDENGSIKVFRYSGGIWNAIAPNIFFTQNSDLNALFASEGYFFPVKYNGKVYAAHEWFTGLSYKTDIYSGTSFETYVDNAQNLVGVRNTNNQNYFFKLAVNGDGAITGVDSLTADPTDNSAVWAMASHDGNPYIAYKSGSGKLSVKSFDGSNWNLHGVADISTGTIEKLDIRSVSGELYVAYLEVGDQLEVRKWDGTSWVDQGSPTDDQSFLSGINDFRLEDIAGYASVFVDFSSAAHNYRLLRLDGWQTVATTRDYTVDTSVPSDKEYRLLSVKNGCSYTVSGSKRVIVYEMPSITVDDVSRIEEGSVTLDAQVSVGEVYWLDDLEGGGYSGIGKQYTTDVIANDTIYAYAQNGICYSDTVMAKIFINDMDFHDYQVSHPDTVCFEEYSVIELDTSIYGISHRLYEQGSNGVYTPKGNATTSSQFQVYPSQTTTYKIKLEEQVLDAAQFTYGGYSMREHLDFDTVQLNYTNEVTIEGWVRVLGSLTPIRGLGLQYNNTTSGYEPASERNFEWNNNYFKVANGDTARELYFPAFPTDYSPWVHVATTAGPTGLKIYYNGELVASLDSAASGDINHQRANLRYGLSRTLSQLSGLAGLDEFRIWDHERSASEIDSLYNSCLLGNEEGLLVYSRFEDYDFDTKTFTSSVGPNAVFENQPSYTKPQVFRNGYCSYEVTSEKFLEPFTIQVLEGLPYIIDMDERWPTSSGEGEEGFGEEGFGEGEGEEEEPSGGCEGDTVTLNATVSSGIVYWYNAEEGGEVIGSGSPFTIFIDKDTTLYAGVDGRCSRNPVDIDVNGAPKILSASADTTCADGDAYYGDIDFDIDYNDEADDYYLYDAPTGGDPLNSDGGLYDLSFTGTDTLYVSAYNDYCETEERVPVVIVGIFSEITSRTPDTTLCAEGSIELSASFEGTHINWWYDGSYVSTETTYTTPVLTVGTHEFYVDSYYEYDEGNNSCYSDGEYITITVEESPTRYDTIVACGDYTWIDGITYTESNSSILFNKESNVTCDSAIYLNLTIIDVTNPGISVSTTNTCPGETITFSLASTESGVDYSLLNNEETVFAGPLTGTGGELNLTTGALNETQIFRVMANKSVTVGSQSNTCDVQVGDAITVNIGQTTSSRTVARCGDYLWNGTTYFETGVYYDTLTSSLGCDSIASLNLTILPEPTHTYVVEACESYTWKGVTYTESTNTPTWTGQTLYGCDSLVTLDLKIKESVTHETSLAVCDSYEWYETSYTTSGTYMQTLTSSIGCDSTVTVNLTILESTESDTSAVVCDSFDWYGNSYSSSGAYERILTNSVGCDSVITLNLIVNTSTFRDTLAAACSSFDWYGTEYTNSGDYERILTNGAGCDSTVTLHLTIYEPNSSDTTAVSCGPFHWHGNNYTTSGDYSRVIQNTLGCDSTINLHLTVNPASDPEYTSFDVETCHSHIFNGTEFTSSGSYDVTFQNTMGCDSIVTLNLTLLEGKCWKDGAWVNGAPDTSDDVVIADTFTVTTALRVKDLQIADGGTVNVPENGVLEIAGDISNNGSIKLQSGSDFLSYAGNSFSGNDITFERNMRHETAAYSMMGSPVQQSSDVKGSIAGITWAYDESKPYEAGDTEGLKRWINWKNNELVPGQGYASANTEQLIFEGNPNVGTITVENLSYTPEETDSTYAGWQLVANPYGTSIDVGEFLTTNEDIIEGHINLWDDPNTGERGSNSDYLTMNALGVVSSDPRGDRFNNHVLTGQGFFVRRLADITAPGNVIFTEDMRNTGYNQDGAYFRNAEQVPPKIWVTMLGLDGRYSETLIGFPEDATEGLDHFYDAQKIATGATHQIYSVIDNTAFSIQGLPLREEIKVPLGYSRDASGYAIMSIKAESKIPDGYELFIKDDRSKLEYSMSHNEVEVLLDKMIDHKRFSLILRKMDVLGQQEVFDKTVVNRVTSEIVVTSTKKISNIKLVDLMGRSSEINDINRKEYRFKEPGVKAVYLIHVQLTDGSMHTQKLIID